MRYRIRRNSTTVALLALGGLSIEIPTPRWVVYDAVRFGVELGDEVWTTLQERAYTSPIWYTP